MLGGIWRNWTKCVHWLQHIIARKWVANKAEKQRLNWASGEEKKHEPTNASTAGKNFRVSRYQGEPDSAIQTVKPMPEENQESISSTKSVSGAVKHTNEQNWAKAAFAVVPVAHATSTPMGIQKVYNLTVSGQHEYVAQGYLVSNCDSLRYLVQSAIGSRILSILDDMARPPSSFAFDSAPGPVQPAFAHLGQDLPPQDSMEDIMKRMDF